MIIEELDKRLGNMAEILLQIAIASRVLDITLVPMVKEEGKKIQRETRSLSKRGIAIIEIIDKDFEKTYHQKEGVEEMLNSFVKKNNKWKWKKEEYGGIKTGSYILKRVYRSYYKKQKEEDTCECCGRELE